MLKPLRIKVPCLLGHDSRVRAPCREPIVARYVTSLPLYRRMSAAHVMQQPACLGVCVNVSWNFLPVSTFVRLFARFARSAARSLFDSCGWSLSSRVVSMIGHRISVHFVVGDRFPVFLVFFLYDTKCSVDVKLLDFVFLHYVAHARDAQHEMRRNARDTKHTRHPARPGKHSRLRSRQQRRRRRVTLHHLLSRSFSVTWIVHATLPLLPVENEEEVRSIVYLCERTRPRGCVK